MSDASPPRSPSAQDARGQTKISDYFPVVDNARASKRPRTECQLATKSSPAKRLKGVVEEEEKMEEGAVNDPDITLMDTENKGNGELVTTDEAPAALRLDRLSVVEKPNASVAMFDVNPKMVKMNPSKASVEKPSASVAMFDVNPKMVKMNPSKARTNDVAIFAVNPKMVKTNPSKAGATDEQKGCSTSKYRLRPIDKDMDVDTTIPKEGDTASNTVATKTGESASNTLSAAIDVDMVSLVETPNALTINVNAPSKASVSNERCVGKYVLRPIDRDTGVNATTVTKTEDTLPNAFATGNGEYVTKVNMSSSKTSIKQEQKARQHTLKPIEKDSSVDAVDTVPHASATDAGESVTNKLSDAADVDTPSLVNKPNAVATNSDVPDKETKSGPSKGSRRRARKHALKLIEKEKEAAAATAPKTKGNQAAQTKGNQAAQTKGNHHSTKKLRWLDSEDDSSQTRGNQAAQTKSNHHSTKKLRWPDSEDDSSRDSGDGVKGNFVSPFARQTAGKTGLNLEFYRNKVQSVPDGDYIENILNTWKDDFKRLEKHHGYIQWLFPIKESGMNNMAQVLQDGEAKAIREDAILKGRVLRAYKMMLGFFGLVIKDDDVGIIGPSPMYHKQIDHLNSSYHNYLRITRILKALGEFGFEHLKKPLLVFLIQEAFVKNTLVNSRSSCVDFWIPTLAIKEEREGLQKMVKELEKTDKRRTGARYFN